VVRQETSVDGEIEGDDQSEGKNDAEEEQKALSGEDTNEEGPNNHAKVGKNGTNYSSFMHDNLAYASAKGGLRRANGGVRSGNAGLYSSQIFTVLPFTQLLSWTTRASLYH
jgi:hypothetical protein